MPDFNDLPPTLWILCQDRGPDDAAYLWEAPPHCTPDDEWLMFAFTTRERAEDYADTLDDEMIVAREFTTADLPAFVARARRGPGAVGIDADTPDSRFMPWAEFEEMVGVESDSDVPFITGAK